MTAELLVNVDVPDLVAAEAFYTGAFALEVGRRFGGDAVELLGANAKLYLLHKEGGTTGAGQQPRDYARHWSPIQCDLVVDDVDAALARAIAAGAQQEGATRDANWGRIVQLADPFGHGWCLIQFSAAGYDAIST